MNNLLFTALIIALLYYFFYYLPSQKKLNPNPTTTKLTHSQFTQTDDTSQLEDEIEPSLDQLIKGIQELNQALEALD